jgi:thymidylate synthase (FAD)
MTSQNIPENVDLFSVNQPETISLYDDLGYVSLVDMMPRIVPQGRTAEIAIVQCARTSYLSEGKSVEADNKLINYLVKNKHTSPLESVVFQFEMRIPIFVERQLIRHRTARVNEQSMRYTVVEENDYFLPQLRMQSKTNKQGSNENAIVPKECEELWNVIDIHLQTIYKLYTELAEAGVAKEVIRCALPVAQMTKVMWQMDLHNLVHFLKLRTASDAQKEIRDLAEGILKLITPYVPHVIELMKENS